jgi:hypothetical protein
MKLFFDIVELITKKLGSEKNAFINYVNTEIYPQTLKKIEMRQIFEDKIEQEDVSIENWMEYINFEIS